MKKEDFKPGVMFTLKNYGSFFTYNKEGEKEWLSLTGSSLEIIIEFIDDLGIGTWMYSFGGSIVSLFLLWEDFNLIK